jgi:hypothetical protein
MIDETIKRIENTVENNENLSEGRKNELLALISNLKEEIVTLDESHRDEAGSIVRYAESSIREAVKTTPDSELLDHTLKGLTLSVRRFEITHPKLIGLINNIGQTLRNIGI